MKNRIPAPAKRLLRAAPRLALPHRVLADGWWLCDAATEAAILPFISRTGTHETRS